jgi:XTP/dITP diphosphohydrolase
MKELLIATGNNGKVTELTALLAGMDITLYSLKDFPDLRPVIEDGNTFADNAVKKALAASLATGLPVVADDSGLMVDALGGRPGVHSARYAGDDAGDAANNSKLLLDLAGVSQERRTASFKCVIALCLPGEECRTFSGELHGFILESAAGSGGFGYDPLFMVPEYGKTLAELPLAIKNRISHRGRAFAKLKEYLLDELPHKSKA